MSPRHVVVLALAIVGLLAAVVATAADARGAAPSCGRGGARLIAADDRVRVLRIARRPRGSETRRAAIVSCWTPTGRRATLVVERDYGLDLVTTTRVQVVDGRYVGTIVTGAGGVTVAVSAAVHDARTGRRLHDTRACDVERGELTGIDEAVFLPRGGMAFACDRLLLYATARAAPPRELEPLGAGVRQLAASSGAAAFFPRIYWTAVVDGAEVARSFELRR